MAHLHRSHRELNTTHQLEHESRIRVQLGEGGWRLFPNHAQLAFDVGDREPTQVFQPVCLGQHKPLEHIRGPHALSAVLHAQKEKQRALTQDSRHGADFVMWAIQIMITNKTVAMMLFAHSAVDFTKNLVCIVNKRFNTLHRHLTFCSTSP